MNINYVIFDFNGTLLWDTELHNLAWDEFLAKHHIYLSDAEKNRRIHGKLNREILTDLLPNPLSELDIQQYLLEKESIYQQLRDATGLEMVEGAIDLFEELKQQGIPFAIATASGIENVSYYKRIFNLHKWFDDSHIIYNDGTMRGKPYPDLFLKAMSVLGSNGEHTVIFEDSFAGIEAARAAKSQGIVIVNSVGENYEKYENKYPIITSFKSFKFMEYEEK